MKSLPYPSRSAFSLVELSIVLVILGLLAGGVLSGQSLIRAAEMRGVATDAQRYATALNSFRDKYFSLPGDMSNATQFWHFAGTTSTPGCITNWGAAEAAPGACDGNGDGVISAASAGNTTGESFQAWKHLALAGLIEGMYSGKSGASASDYIVGTNAPTSKIKNAGWMLTYISNPTGAFSNHLYNYDYRN